MQNREHLFWIWLAEALGCASKHFRRLTELYDNPYEIFHAEDSEIERIPYLTERVISALENKDLEPASRILDACQREGIEILPYADARYPILLREIEAPPVVLYCRGRLPDWNRRLCIGMVGTRHMSAYGMHTAYKLSYELTQAGALVVSGMATGIDGVSAAAAMEAGGETVAVLGCGADVIYPKHHAPLYRSILEKGAILSEYPPGTPPASFRFPVRNRLISGLSQGTVVVEAGMGSGSLITAKDAILQGRDVFALPANIGSRGAEGTNGLIRDGARLALSTADVLEPYRYVYAQELRGEEASPAPPTDLHRLESYGVIELTPPTKEGPPPADPPAPIPHSERRQRRASSVKGERAEPRGSKTQSEKREPMPSSRASGTEARPSAVSGTPEGLTPVQLAVLAAIPDGEAVSADLFRQLEHPYGDTIAALTMLEIMGLVEKLPGGLYTKV